MSYPFRSLVFVYFKKILEFIFLAQTEVDAANDTSDIMDEGETETSDNPPQHPLICLQDKLAAAAENRPADCAINNKLKFIQVGS